MLQGAYSLRLHLPDVHAGLAVTTTITATAKGLDATSSGQSAVYGRQGFRLLHEQASEEQVLQEQCPARLRKDVQRLLAISATLVATRASNNHARTIVPE